MADQPNNQVKNPNQSGTQNNAPKNQQGSQTTQAPHAPAVPQKTVTTTTTKTDPSTSKR